jgi:flagellar motor protein MotB
VEGHEAEEAALELLRRAFASDTELVEAITAIAELREAISEREGELMARALEEGFTVRSLGAALRLSKSAVHRRSRRRETKQPP